MADRVKTKVTDEQLLILLEAMKGDNKFLLDPTPRSIKRRTVNSKWRQVALQLNAVQNGAFRSVPKWQQFWRDWKSNTKKKVKAGGQTNLTELETSLLKVIGFGPNHIASNGPYHISFSHIVDYVFNSSRGPSPRVQVAEYILDKNAPETEEQLRRRNMEVDVGRTIEEIVSRQNMENGLCERGRRQGIGCIRFVYIDDL